MNDVVPHADYQPPATQDPQERKAIAASIRFGERGIEVENFAQLWRVSALIANSNLKPKSLQRVEDVALAIMFGRGLGLDLLASIQNIAPINGVPSVWGDAALALVRTSGLMEDIQESFEGTPYEPDFKAVCIVRRKGQASEIRREFSVQDAKDAQLWGKSGTWQTARKRMLQMRARGFALRDGFPDVLKGLRLREELVGEPADETSVEVLPTVEQPTTLDALAEVAAGPDGDNTEAAREMGAAAYRAGKTPRACPFKTGAQRAAWIEGWEAAMAEMVEPVEQAPTAPETAPAAEPEPTEEPAPEAPEVEESAPETPDPEPGTVPWFVDPSCERDPSEMGARAFKEGCALAENPFHSGRKQSAWLRGYTAARRAAKRGSAAATTEPPARNERRPSSDDPQTDLL